VKWREEKYLNARFRASRPKFSPLCFKAKKVTEIALRAALFWAFLGQFPGAWGIFSNPRDSKLVREGHGFQWNGQRKNIWTLGFELQGRNIAPLYFEAEKVAEIVLHGAWFWPTLGRFPGTLDIISNPRDSKITREGLGFQWNGQRKNIWTLGFELPGWNIAPLYFKGEKVAETALHAALFWPTLGRFPRTWGIIFNARDAKLTRDGLGFQWNGQRKDIWTLGFQLLGRNIAPHHFNAQKVAETAFRAAWIWPTLGRFPRT